MVLEYKGYITDSDIKVESSNLCSFIPCSQFSSLERRAELCIESEDSVEKLLKLEHGMKCVISFVLSLWHES